MNWRYRFALLSFLCFFSIILLRLFYWQIVRAEELSQMGESQYGKNIKLTPERGEIRTSDGFPIAANKLTYLLFANPKTIKDPQTTTDVLSPLLEMDPASISAMLTLNRYWVPIKGGLEQEVKEKIEKRNIIGIGFDEQPTRFYPEASLAAKLIGFVGKDDNGDNSGYFGLEGYYDRQLRGKAGLAMQIHDALGKPILAKMNQHSGEIDGRHLTLHIDRTIQYILDEEIKKGIEIYGALGGMAAVMDPKTGSILALSSFPTFDPSTYYDFSGDLYINPFISSSYEPGSTFKPLVMAAAIDAGVVKPNTPCPICDKPVEIGGYKIKTWNDTYKAGITMSDVIRDSDNTGMVYVAQEMGLERMFSSLKRFGFGEVTGIDLQGEMAPSLRPKDSWYPIDLATASFGQGISVTPLQLLSAFSSLANEGVRMKPQVVKEVETSKGEKIVIAPVPLGQTVSAKTTKVMTEIMVKAVKQGEAKWAAPKGYRIAGKTGTAQIPIAGHYDATKTIPSFIGFAPADNPKFVMLVVYDRPTSSIYGSETAAPTFFKVATKILSYYGIPPTE